MDTIGYKRPILRRPESKMTLADWDEHYRNHMVLHKKNVQAAAGKADPELVDLLKREREDKDFERLVAGEVGKEFPASLNLFNLGIRDQKVQRTTLHSVKFLNSLKDEIGQIVASTAPDRAKRELLQQPTTTFHLHKNMMEMRALKGRFNVETLRQSQPEAAVDAAQGDEFGTRPKTDFSAKYDRLTEHSRFRRVVDNTETVEPTVFSHEGPHHGKYRRHLKAEERMVIGLGQRVEDQIRYVNNVGRTHLHDNDFRNKRNYDELDVVCFDRARFMQRLKKLEDRDPVTFKRSLVPPKPTDNAELLEKRFERRQVDEEFDRLVLNRLRKNSGIDALQKAKEAHKAALGRISGVDQELTDQIVPKSIFDVVSKIGDLGQENPF